MEFEQLITLVKEVSGTELSQFSFEDGSVKVSMKKEKKQVIQTLTAENTMVPVQMTGPACEVEAESIKGKIVTSPLVGIFYSASGPEAEAFVQVGDTVTKGQTLGIVEAMKLMNEIECEYEGTIKEVLVKNEEPVEYGQPLFVIDQRRQDLC